MVGKLAREQPHEPSQWWKLHLELVEKGKRLGGAKEIGVGELVFAAIMASHERLPPEQMKQFLLLIVMPPGIPATREMLASLWDMVRTWDDIFFHGHIGMSATVQLVH